MKKYLLLLFIASLSISTFAQNTEMAKAFYKKALQAYEDENYEEALRLIEKTKENLNGNTNPDIIYIEAKSRFKNDMRANEAKKLFNRFLKESSVNDERRNEVTSVLVDIETNLVSNRKMTYELSLFFEKSNTFFKKTVSNGKVDYYQIKNNKDLNEILQIAKTTSVSENDSKTYQAFWINAYNLLVIKGIIDNYPLKSPISKIGFFDKIKYNIGGKEITLNEIENKILREKFNDIRFHFTLVNGSIGSPHLMNRAYLPNKLEKQLESQTILTLNDSKFIITEGNKVYLPKYFEWYKKDFIINGESELDFINKYRNVKLGRNFKINYSNYNWNLNKQ